MSIVAVQYKLWEEKSLYLSDKRVQNQLERLKKFVCDNNICDQTEENDSYRFPYCAAFLRPTDKLQKADQKFVSTGEHLPICKIGRFATETARGAHMLDYKNIKEASLNSEMFEYLFNKGKIGSRTFSYSELKQLYGAYLSELSESDVVIYAQEFTAPTPLFREFPALDY